VRHGKKGSFSDKKREKGYLQNVVIKKNIWHQHRRGKKEMPPFYLETKKEEKLGPFEERRLVDTKEGSGKGETWGGEKKKIARRGVDLRGSFGKKRYLFSGKEKEKGGVAQKSFIFEKGNFVGKSVVHTNQTAGRRKGELQKRRKEPCDIFIKRNSGQFG